MQKLDPHQHMRGNHNCRGFYDHTKPWVTHCSVQSSDMHKIPEGKKPPKGRFKSNPFSIKSLTLLKKMYIETTASSKVFSKQPEGSPPTQVGEDCKKKSHVLRFSEYSLKILFAKDLLKMLEKLSSGTQEYKNPSKDGLLLFNSKKGALSPDKAQKATGSKDLNSSSLTQKNNREEILSQIKKELDSLQKQLVQDSNLLKPREKSLKEVFNLLHREISSISSEIKEMPKIRMQILHSELVNIKSKINSELKNTKASSEKKEGSTFLSATKAEVERSSFEKLKILDTQKKFSRLITLYHSLLQLKQALIEGRNFSIFTNGGLFNFNKITNFGMGFDVSLWANACMFTLWPSLKFAAPFLTLSRARTTAPACHDSPRRTEVSFDTPLMVCLVPATYVLG